MLPLNHAYHPPSALQCGDPLHAPTRHLLSLAAWRACGHPRAPGSCPCWPLAHALLNCAPPQAVTCIVLQSSGRRQGHVLCTSAHLCICCRPAPSPPLGGRRRARRWRLQVRRHGGQCAHLPGQPGTRQRCRRVCMCLCLCMLAALVGCAIGCPDGGRPHDMLCRRMALGLASMARAP